MHKANYYNDRFLPNTYINGIDCSDMTVEEAEQVYLDDYYSYDKTIYIGENSYDVTRETYQFSNVEKLEKYILIQDSKDWYRALNNKTEIETDIGDTFEKTVDFIMSDWNIFDESTWVDGENAYLAYDYESYKVVPEKYGTRMDLDLARSFVESQLRGEEVQDTNSVYLPPEITASDEELNRIAGELNGLIYKTITFKHDDKSYVIEKDRIEKYLEVNFEDDTYEFDVESLADDFVEDLANELNTVDKEQIFATHDKLIKKISGGNWGNEIDKDKIKEEIINIFEDFEITEAEGTIYWSQFHDKTINEGNYVEVDMINQKVFLFYEGELLGSSGTVTGDESDGHATPPGVFNFWYKTRNAILRGDDYENFVNYWMPFNGGIGLHDATWRSVFGGNIYQRNGSHGCVNLPLDMAKLIYQYLDDTFAIVCYN